MSANPVQFPSNKGGLVPVDPENPQSQLDLERREEVFNAPVLLKFLNNTLDAIARLDQNENLKIHNQMITSVAYYDGRWDGQCKNGEWIDNETVDGEIQPKDNEFKKQVDKLQMEMCRSKISYEASAVNKYSAEMREAAEFAQHRLEVNQKRIETEPFVQSENMSLLLKTIALRYTFFDRNASSQETTIEMQIMKHLNAGSSVTVCRTCGKSVDDESADMKPDNEGAEAYQCPSCGDTETKEVSSPDSEGLQIDAKQVSAGRAVTVRPDATMVQLDLNARDIPGSAFLRWRLSMRRCDWEAMFPGSKIPSGDETEEGRKRSQSQNQVSNSEYFTSSADNVGGGDQFEKIEGELVWLDPKVYQRYKNKQTEKLKNGKILQAGEPFVQTYPVGCCVARIGKTILDIWPSNKNKCWTMVVYGLREHALHGAGLTALLGPQDTINDENSFIVAHHYYGAAGREFIRSGALDGGTLPAYNKVGIIDAPNEVSNIAEWAYARSQPEALASDVYLFREAMRGSLQDAAGTSSLSTQGAADMKALGTATGVEASRDQAVGRMIPNRKLQAFMGSEWGMQILELERENYTVETFLETAGKADEKGEIQYSERGVRAFFNADIRNDFEVNPTEGSWIPETSAQKTAKAAGFAQVAGQVKGDPQLMSILAPNFGVDFSVDEWGAAQRNASLRLEQYARVSKVIESAGYSPGPDMVQIVLQNVPEWARINPQMDRHESMRNFYEDWWLSDEGRNASPLLRMVVVEIHSMHLNNGLVPQAQEQGAAQIASQAPQMIAQEQMANEQKAQQQQEMGQANEQDNAQTAQQAVGEQALKERDREHQAQVDAQAREHEAGLQKEVNLHQAAVNAATAPKESE